MNNQLPVALLSGASALFVASAAMAQDGPFTWEGEIEIGIESVFDSNIPGNEGKDPFLTGELYGEFALGEHVAVFGGLTLEEMTGPSDTIEDLGLYVHELGVRVGNERLTFSAGKVTPVFGTAWDLAGGYFGSTIAEDYELTEAIGGVAEADLGQAGSVAVSVFYLDNTVLSRSLGFNRGKNRTSAGGAGNTGELDNVTVQWMKDFGSTQVHVGARHLSKGTGDLSDETGFVGGIVHSFEGAGTPLELFVEVASFDGFGGAPNDAVYATATAVYTMGSTSFSAAFAHRDIDTVGETDLFSIGIDHEFENGTTIGGALAHVDDVGGDDNLFGISMIIPLGG